MSAAEKSYSSAIGGAVNYTAWVIDAFRPYFGRNLLEVGLGHGGYRDVLPPLARYVGIDIDPEAVAAARARAREASDLFIQADITDPGLKDLLAGLDVDTVLCVNVMEHIEDDRSALANLLEVLPAGGHLLLFVPAFKALYNDLDRFAGHHRRYRKSDLRDLIPPQSGRLLACRYFNPVGALGWWINGFARHDSLDDVGVNRQIEVFDRYVLPISRALDPITRPFFGQSLIAVVQRL